jgi:hypothetical protein
MQFHIDVENNSFIGGWLLPDNPSTIPTFIISSAGRPQIRLLANFPRPDIRDLGHHNTGVVGFAINETIVPDLPQLTDLEVRDADTGILIYRRAKGLARKIFCINLATVPPVTLAEPLLTWFRLCYDEIERHPFDTLFSILNNQWATSLFASGRPILARYDEVLRRNDFMVIALLRHPHEDLAQRLLVAREIVRNGSVDHSEAMGPLVQLAQSVPLEQSDALEAELTKIAAANSASIVNPFVRVLACGPNDRPEQRHVAIALNNLAAMDLVGSAGRLEDFKSILAEMLQENVLEGLSVQRSDELEDLTRRVASMPGVNGFLALDLSLFSHVEEAIEAAASASLS